MRSRVATVAWPSHPVTQRGRTLIFSSIFYPNFCQKPWQLTEPNSSLKIHVFPCLGTGRPKPRGHSFILAITPFKIHGIWGSVCQLLKVISCLPSMACTYPVRAVERCCAQLPRSMSTPTSGEMLYTSMSTPTTPLSPYPASLGNHAWAYRHNCPARLDV